MRNFTDPAAAGSAAATADAEARAATLKDEVLLHAPHAAGYRKAGILADLIGGRLDAKQTDLYLHTAFGILRVRNVRQFSDGPWVVCGAAHPLNQRSFAVDLFTVLYSKEI